MLCSKWKLLNRALSASDFTIYSNTSWFRKYVDLLVCLVKPHLFFSGTWALERHIVHKLTLLSPSAPHQNLAVALILTCLLLSGQVVRSGMHDRVMFLTCRTSKTSGKNLVLFGFEVKMKYILIPYKVNRILQDLIHFFQSKKTLRIDNHCIKKAIKQLADTRCYP